MWAQLKKFGLDYDDFPTIMENVSLLLWVLTINIQRKWTQRVHLIFYLTTPIAFFTYLYVYLFTTIWLVFFKYGKKDIEASSVILAIGLNSIISATKFLFMKLYANEIKNTVHDFLQCDSQVVPNTRFAKNLRKNLRVVKKRSLLIWITFAANGLIYLILPLATPGRHFTIELFLLYGLEPMFESPNYEIATVIFTISSGFAVYSMVGIAVYVLVIVGYNEAQMYTLSEELRNLWNDSRKFYNHNKHKISDKRQAVYMKEQIMNEFIRIRLKDIIRFHIANINLLRELNQELRPLLALEYTLLVIAIIAELLGGLEHTYLALPYTIVQMLMDCLAGQRLIDASDDFERSVYSCQWEHFNTSNQKTVFLMLMMSEKTLILSTGGFATLNYQFLMAILKTSYSTYTTLKSTVN
ncbi:unnamed protein product [Euphydryas editha]|uniref:Odorant receptor n=1 Tax=Euphydryas editha TaxID=104508 RepID=A0AAU9U4E5_EUPED|nr:unnamed protein product [Euphydryas editha]